MCINVSVLFQDHPLYKTLQPITNSLILLELSFRLLYTHNYAPCNPSLFMAFKKPPNYVKCNYVIFPSRGNMMSIMCSSFRCFLSNLVCAVWKFFVLSLNLVEFDVCLQDGFWIWRQGLWRKRDSSLPWGCAWAHGAPLSAAWGVCDYANSFLKGSKRV